MGDRGRTVRVLHGVVVYGKHKNDYPGGRDKGATVGGNVRYDRRNPTKSMDGFGYSEPLAK